MTEFERKKFFWLRFAAIAAAGILLMMLVLGIGTAVTLRRVQRYEKQADAIMSTLETVAAELDSVDWVSLTTAVNSVSAQLTEVDLTETVKRLDDVSKTLAEIDFVAMAEDMDTLMLTAQDSLTQAQDSLALAQKAVEELDIEGLNAAVTELQAVLEPLSRFFEKLG